MGEAQAGGPPVSLLAPLDGDMAFAIPPVLRVGMVSDTHGFLHPRIAEYLAGSDYVLHAGDIGNADVLAQLRRIAGQVLAVRGNNDVPAKWPAQDLACLRDVPLAAALDLPGGQVVLVHGDRCPSAARRHDCLRRGYPDARAIVYGHSHYLLCDQTVRPWVLNPGAAGKTRTRGGASCLRLIIRDAVWEIESVRMT